MQLYELLCFASEFLRPSTRDMQKGDWGASLELIERGKITEATDSQNSTAATPNLLPSRYSESIGLFAKEKAAS